MRRLLVCLAVFAALAFTFSNGPVAKAGLIVGSTFDSGDEGWLVGELTSPAGTTFAPTYSATGGNPGGFIRTTDRFSWTAYFAPTKFLGNQSAAYGGSLRFDQRSLRSDGFPYPVVGLSDGTKVLFLQAGTPGTDWTHFNISLVASAGWRVATTGIGGPNSSPASEADLKTVLSNLAFLRINADWISGADQVDLDNVQLFSASAVPEPSSLLLALSSLGPAYLWRRNRRRIKAA